MKIVAPISRVEETAPMIRAGADELYCGIVPADWTERFRSSGVNRRAFGNLGRYEDLAEVVRIAADLDASISLVMNAQHYTEPQIAALGDLAERFATMGGHALIVGDLGLLAQLAGRDLPLRLHASSLLACRNAETAALLGELGVGRVVFPRDVTPAEMAAIAAANAALEFEAFILNDGCVFEEGNCHTIHLPGRLGGPICLDRYTVDHARVDGGALGADERAALADNDAAYDQWLWYRFSCGFAVTEAGYPFGPCGLCAVPSLAAGRIGAVKIAGREGAMERKLKSVEMVRATLDRLDRPAGELTGFARAIRGRLDLCATGHMCYYRDAMPKGDDCIRTEKTPRI